MPHPAGLWGMCSSWSGCEVILPRVVGRAWLRAALRPASQNLEPLRTSQWKSSFKQSLKTQLSVKCQILG